MLLLAAPHRDRRAAGGVAHTALVDEQGTAGRTTSFGLIHGLTVPHPRWPQPQRRDIANHIRTNGYTSR
jgi:hypothetical protein